MGFATFFYQPTPGVSSLAQQAENQKVKLAPAVLPSGDTLVVDNGIISITFDTTTGLITTWTDILSGVATPFSQVIFSFSVKKR